MTKLIFVGGFLGAGKTSLLYEVTRLLKSREINVGIITNDQAPDLADTVLLEHHEMNIAEVAGSCFCCDFKALKKAIGKVGINQKTDIIIAEPVGSCADLATRIFSKSYGHLRNAGFPLVGRHREQCQPDCKRARGDFPRNFKGIIHEIVGGIYCREDQGSDERYLDNQSGVSESCVSV